MLEVHVSDRLKSSPSCQFGYAVCFVLDGEPIEVIVENASLKLSHAFVEFLSDVSPVKSGRYAVMAPGARLPEKNFRGASRLKAMC